MKFILLIHGDEQELARRDPALTKSIVEGHMRFAADLRGAGKMVASERLRPEAEATRIRLKNGHVQVTDGPFAETKEVLGGFYLIECASKVEALEWARKLPLEGIRVEVRPVWEM
ncbi:MAG: YciI family protein [Candidatus Rokubacteria bacterium]|nr:YciI family protein [Candidatus Rokubacteria bacterium]